MIMNSFIRAFLAILWQGILCVRAEESRVGGAGTGQSAQQGAGLKVLAALDARGLSPSLSSIDLGFVRGSPLAGKLPADP